MYTLQAAAQNPSLPGRWYLELQSHSSHLCLDPHSSHQHYGHVGTRTCGPTPAADTWLCSLWAFPLLHRQTGTLTRPLFIYDSPFLSPHSSIFPGSLLSRSPKPLPFPDLFSFTMHPVSPASCLDLKVYF